MTRGAWTVVVLLSLLTAGLYASCGSRVFHNLENRPEWISTKPGLARDVMGSLAFVKTPMALHANALNLGAWHGFQEVFWRDPLSPRSVSFRFRLPSKGSYLSFLYSPQEGSFSEIRLSRSRIFPSQWSKLTPERERISAVPFGGMELDAAWHDAKVDFLDEGVAVSVDRVEYFRNAEPFDALQRIGFRGSQNAVYIDDVEILDDRGGVLAADAFGVRSRLWPIGVCAIALSGLGWFVGWLRSRSKPSKERKRAAFQAALLFYMALLIVAVPFTLVERSFLSGRHGYSALHFRVWKWIARPGRPPSSYVHVVPLLRETWADSQPGAADRIILVGTSQTWGSGASRWDRDLAHRLASVLTEASVSRSFEVINGGISGRRSDLIFPYYQDEWVDWGATTAVINLGNNDPAPEIFEKMLEKFVELNRERNIRTVFVLEANSPETFSKRLLENHEIIKAVAERNDLAVIDLHGALLEAADDGQLWWDSVHLTDYGQQRAAHVLGTALAPLLLDTPNDR